MPAPAPASAIDVYHSVVRMPLFGLPVASPLVHLGERHVLISPGSQLTDEDYRAMGPVTDLVANNLGHAAGMPHAARFFPQARRWGVPGLAARRRDVAFTDELRPETWPFADALPMVAIDGMPRWKEVVFVHRQSRTLVVSDLAFNLVDTRGAGAWIITHLFGTYRRFGVSRLLLAMVKDRPAMQASLDRLFQLDFDRVIVSHGHELPTGGRAALADALRERGFTTP